MTDFTGVIERIFFLYAGETQAQIGESIGVSQDLVSGWKRGLSTPRIPELMKITQDRGVSWEWLMTGRGSMEPPRAVEIPGEDAVSADRPGEYPVVGYAAADDLDASRADFFLDENIGTIDLPLRLAAVEITGDSMSPVVLDKQHALIRTDPAQRLATGMIAIIDVREGAAEFKEVHAGVYCKRIHVDDEMLILTSINTAYNSPFTVWRQNATVYPVLGVWFGDRATPPRDE